MPAVRRAAPGHLAFANWAEIDETVARYVRSAIKRGIWPIVLQGPVGTGKSCTAACVFRSWPYAAHWYRLETFIKDVTTCRTSKDKKVACRLANGETIHRTEAGLWGLAGRASSLWCLDDLGTRKLTESGYDIVFELFERRTGLPLIVSTNLNREEIAKTYDERIADRIGAGVIIEMLGESRRKGAKVSVQLKSGDK